MSTVIANEDGHFPFVSVRKPELMLRLADNKVQNLANTSEVINRLADKQ